MKQNPRKSMVTSGDFGTVTTMTFLGVAAVVGGIIWDIRNGKLFNKELREKYGYTDKMTEGLASGNVTRKLWDNHNKWEKEHKGNFRLVKGLVENMDFKPGEYITVQSVTDKSGNLKKEIFHMIESGFYHDEII